MKCVMSPRDWAVACVGVALVVGAVFVQGGSEGKALAALCAVLGLLCLVWVLLGRRVALIADEAGLTYRTHFGSRNIAWKRLSSMQFKADSNGRAESIVVVNDMGRKDMRIRAGDFDRQRLHDFVESLPTRSSGRQRLLG